VFAGEIAGTLAVIQRTAPDRHGDSLVGPVTVAHLRAAVEVRDAVGQPLRCEHQCVPAVTEAPGEFD
jgi:hypothetical protein